MNTPIKEATGWAVVTRTGNIIHDTVNGTRQAAIIAWRDGFLGMDPIAWTQWRKDGYRCVRVRIVPVEGAE